MRIRYTIPLLFILFLFPALIYSQGVDQFVTLRGRQFYKPDGTPFYPLVINYSVDLFYNQGTSVPIPDALYIMPVVAFGTSRWLIECNDQTSCLNQIETDFIKIKSLGFNTIRLNNVFYEKAVDGLVGGQVRYAARKSNGWPNEVLEQLPLTPPYSDPLGNTARFFQLLGMVINLAEQHDLFVILDETKNGYSIIKTNNWQANKADYLNYVGAKADYFKLYPNLLAHAFVEEPDHTNFNKGEICEFMSDIYDRAKGMDPLHLITYGPTKDDVIGWDPAVCKVDFLSPHYYLGWNKDGTNTYDLSLAKLRIQSDLYYEYLFCPMPWIVGEIGFSAIDDDATYTSNQTNIPPYTDGTVSEQGVFTQESLGWVRDCNASGYSWWNYQENMWGSPREDGLGLLRHGDVNDPANTKPAATKFYGYLTNDMAPTPSPPLTPPNNFDDPYLYNTNYYNIPNIVQGTLKDINGNGIAGAVHCWVRYGIRAMNGTVIHELTGRRQFTSLGSSMNSPLGFFKITPFYQGSFDYPLVRETRISCYGCDVISEGSWVNGMDPDGIGPFVPINSDRIINHYEPFRYDEFISGVVPVNEIKEFYGWNSVTANSTFIYGTSNITARDEINLQSQFEAQRFSEVHIFPSEVFQNCTLFSNYSSARRGNFEESRSNNNDVLTLNFIRESDEIIIYPNPSTGIFRINIDMTDRNEYLIDIFDFSGRLILQDKLNSPSRTIDLSKFSKGIYLLKLQARNQNFTKKIIIN